MKLASFTVAGVMVIQSTLSYAQVNRVDGIGNQSIEVAQQQLSAVRMQMEGLDKSLEQAASAIQKREKGGLTNGAAIVGAGIGLGFAALTMAGGLSRSGDGGGGIGVIVGSLGSLAATATALGFSGLSAYLKADADTTSIDSQLENAQKDIMSALASTSDKSTTALLVQLNNSLVEVQVSLASYREDESARSKHKLMANIAQATGAAIIFFGLTQSSGSKMVTIGNLVMSAGGLGRIVTGLSDSQADQLLEEIAKTRQTLRTAATAL